ERDGILDGQRAYALATQGRQVGAAAQRFADVLGKHPDVGSLAAGHADAQTLAVEAERLDPVYPDAPRWPLEDLPGARILVERLAVALERRMHRRYLVDLADEPLDDLHAARHVDAGDTVTPVGTDLALGVAGRGREPEPDLGQVGLVGVEQAGGKLGRLAEEQGQQARSKRVERAAMAGAGAAERAPRPHQGGVRRQADRLVEQQHPIVTGALS